MKRLLLLIVPFSLFVNFLFSQDFKATVYDLKSGTVDTLYYDLIDSIVTEDFTPFYIGDYNTDVNQLEMSIPIENVWDNTNFTIKQKASDVYNIENYPIRTSIKLFRMENDTLKQKCSGSIISGKHILTASHCVSSLSNDTLLFDSLYVSPIYNNGEFNEGIDCSWVNKVYTFKNRHIDGREDIAVLELENLLGLKTGWIGLGFNDNDSLLGDGVFYKFSYPGITILNIDSTEYNGDTLYYSYGKVDSFTDAYFGVDNYESGIPGESGSSLIKVENSEFYVSYGVLSYSHGIRHSRITNATFYAIEEIIQPYLSSETLNSQDSDYFYLYPNPVHDNLIIESKQNIEVKNCSLYSLTGKKLQEMSINTFPYSINVAELPKGYYFLRLITESDFTTLKFIKTGF